jgi:hypothetical protein
MITIADIKSAVYERFSGSQVYFSAEELPPEFKMPADWQNFGLGGAGRYPQCWRLFMDKLPWVFKLIENCLMGTVIVVEDKIYLAYIFHDEEMFYFYTGEPPVAAGSQDYLTVENFPPRLAVFYTMVHNGFTFSPANSMGPMNIKDLSRIVDLVDGDTDFSLSLTTIFSNGGGDYLAIDLSEPNRETGAIWFHENPLELEEDVNLFAVMDAWISIFLEDSRFRDEFLVTRV